MKAMICPRCKTNLEMSDNKAIEMDCCPACKGVWLDSGELDRILKRSDNYESKNRDRNDHDSNDEKYHNDEFESEHDNRYDYGRFGYRNQTRRRKRFLSESCDF
jgi:Zn-finger nucleic acid-binding protein